ncbi:NUDIX domain-containing protein [Flavobacterium sp.]|uniref:NUDIX hydrolase n=1 Tax=Flavobacterium sp. TaxID=239 RepID=UPI00375283BE
MSLESILNNSNNYQPGLSIDCVIFGFHDNSLKVLLLKPKFSEKWTLPGGFVTVDDSIDVAAVNVLKERTGLTGIFLRQFATFGDINRDEIDFNTKVLEFFKIPKENAKWYLQRFVTIGYYALVDFFETIPSANGKYEIIEWIDLNNIPELILDHNKILNKALENLRLELNSLPIGFNLLPEKFTMTELQKLYETILGRELDRRNFFRKMNSIGILKKLDEKKSNVSHKAPNFYCFDTENYQKVLKDGLNMGW